MQWSKLKTRFRAFVCDELQDRLDFHVTSYRESHDGAGEIWITLDGKKLVDYGHYRFEFAEREGYYGGLAGKELEDWLTNNEISSPKFVGSAMREYLDMTLDDALASSNPFHRAFAMIDRRLGKRTLEKLKIGDEEHSLIRLFHDLRLGDRGSTTPKT
jgi:hypothetical protein